MTLKAQNLEYNAEKLQEIPYRIMQVIVSLIITSALMKNILTYTTYTQSDTNSQLCIPTVDMYYMQACASIDFMDMLQIVACESLYTDEKPVDIPVTTKVSLLLHMLIKL